MKPKTQANAADLRRRAERRVTKCAKTAVAQGPGDARRLIHELEVHQVELELQNEELRQARAESDANYNELYDLAPVGYFTLGPFGDIQKTNLTGAGMLGQPRSQLHLRRLAEFVKEDSRAAFNEFLRRVTAGFGKESCVVTLLKGGTTPVVAYIEGNGAGPNSRWNAVVVDISAAEYARAALRDSEAHLKLALAASGMGVWEYECDSGDIYWSQECIRLLGVDALSPKLDTLEKLVHVEDLRRVTNAIGQALTDDKEHAVECRIVRPNGELAWIYACGRAEFDGVGRPVRLSGVGQDITERRRTEQVVSRIMETLDKSSSVFAMADAGGALLYLNPAGRDLLGLRSQDATTGMSLTDCHAPGVREHLTQVAMPAAVRDGSWSGESTLLASDGSEISTTLVVIAHHGADGQLTGYSVHERDMRDWVKAEEASRAPERELRQMGAQHLAIQESERRRIAADLHDALGQSLSLLKLEVQSALRQLGADAPKKSVDSVKRLLPRVEGALNDLRRIAMDLRPSSLDDLGILPTISWFVREFESVNLTTSIEEHIGISESDVPQALKITIYRILQEAVNNAVKHADAKRISISLQHEDGALTFAIEDDGKGFDPGAMAERGDARRGLGMRSMKERAELSGATYALHSAVGQGTKVCLRWPAFRVADGFDDQAGRGVGAGQTSVDGAGCAPATLSVPGPMCT